MRHDIGVEPSGGWSSFSRSEELVAWLWERLQTWHYLNFTSDTSMWEHREDGSMVYVAFTDNRGERVAEMTFSLQFATTAEESGAYSVLHECLGRFALEEVVH